MSFIKVYVHFVWSTKNREHFLASTEIRKIVWQHIRENAKKREYISILSMGILTIAIVWYLWE